MRARVTLILAYFHLCRAQSEKTSAIYYFLYTTTQSAVTSISFLLIDKIIERTPVKVVFQVLAEHSAGVLYCYIR